MHWSETHQAGLLQVATHTPRRPSQALCVCECVCVCSCVCVSSQHCHTNQGFVNEPLIGNPPSHPRKERGLSPPSPAYQPPISSIREEGLGWEGVGVCAVGGINPLPSHTPTTLCWMLAGVVLGPQASLSPGGARDSRWYL